MTASDPASVGGSSAEQASAPPREQGPVSSRVVAVLTAVAVLPHMVVMVRAAASGWTPSGDQAMLIVRMHDVGTAHTPLVGPYSRFGWDHPGPLLFWLGAPALRLVGPAGVMVLVAALNAASTAGAIAAARRVAGNAFAALVAAAVAVMVHSHGAGKLVDLWNPWVTVLPLLCFLFCVPVAVVHRSRPALASAIVTGSFAAQTHLGNVPVVLAATAAGLVWWWLDQRYRTTAGDPSPAPPDRGNGDGSGPTTSGQISASAGADLASPHQMGPGSGRRGRWSRLGAWWPMGLLVLLWAGPLVDVIVNPPGNLWTLAEFAMGSTEEPAALGDALGAAARELGFWPAWAGADEGVWPVRPAPAWTLLALPAALVAGIVVAHRNDGSLREHDGHGSHHLVSARRSSHLLAFAAYALVVYCAAAFAVTRTTGGLIPYVLRWTWPVAILASCVAALPVLRWLGDLDGPGRSRLATMSVTTAAAVIVLVATLATTRSAFDVAVEPIPPTDRSVGPLSDALREVLPTGSYGLEWRDVRNFSAIPIGTGVELTRHGYGIDFPTDHANRVGGFRATGRTDVPLLVIVGSTPARHFTPPPGAGLILEWDHLSPDDRARADEIEARIRADATVADNVLVAVDTPDTRDELVEAGAGRADVDALHGLEGDRESYQVWLAPPGSPRPR